MTVPGTISPAALADRLVGLVRDQTAAFVHAYAPDFALPSVFAGYPVGPDVRADLAFTLGLLRASGVAEVAGVPIADAIANVLGSIDGDETHTFFSYRVAETLARFGPFDQNELLANHPDLDRANLAVACDSTSWYELLDRGLPANYCAVIARCEVARETLGFAVDDGLLSDLVDRTRRLITANPAGYIDDSEDGTGARYDIYSADVYLFTQPFADRLQPHWDKGFGTVLDLVSTVVASDGSAMTWGRSLGVLALCHTVELAAMALERDRTGDPSRWLGLADLATDRFASWTDGAVSTAHKHRSQNRYRGPDRWLQLTFDCLGKLAWAADHLRGAPTTPGGMTTAELFPDRDEIVWFDRGRHAAVWAFRSPTTAFVVPFVGTAWADYLPAPRNPGLFEVPVDAPLPTGVPTVVSSGERYVAGGLPVQLERTDRGLRVVWDELPPLDPTSSRPALEARRETNFHVIGPALHVAESLDFDVVPDSVSLQLTETRDRPLSVRIECDARHQTAVIDTDGLNSYRSFWAELPRVHQVDIDPSAHLEFSWSVQPLLRIATADPSHHYHRALYDPLADTVVERSFGGHLVHRPEVAIDRLNAVDVFHLHWPEWFVDSPESAAAFVALLEQTGTTLVWTQHNLQPHRDVPRAHELYQAFASAAHVVVHHSEWGRDVCLDRYRFRDDAHHLVLPHGHFGELSHTATSTERAEAERELGLDPCAIRIAIVGAPRRDKQTRDFMHAFARTSRTDMQLLVMSLEGDEAAPDDSRITALAYEFVSRDLYNRRLAAIDVLALPFDPRGEMLTTGVVGDAVGLGLPAIVSEWPYLTEVLGDAGLAYASYEQLVELLESLTTEQIEAAAQASRAHQPVMAWPRIASEFLEALVAFGAIKR